MGFQDDAIEYSDETLSLLATNLKDNDVLYIFKQVFRFRSHGGFKKAYLPDWNTRRRRYDNAFTILEATKFIEKMEDGSSTPYFPTVRGKQLVVHLINEKELPKSDFDKITDKELEEIKKGGHENAG
ncbi:hypothetical protein ACFPOG_12675 [Paenibacillus aestuarii]|uniref:Antirepressor protein C-terminal domain-containing protein n=1 Tax=Paenibacillus aestuarii TaxID=516965 RepID=A0ABW0K7A6_9BACL